MANDDRPGDGDEKNSGETPEVGLVPDEDLPEDLQPAENPLAQDPDDEDDDGEKPGNVEGMPDLGGPEGPGAPA